MRAGPSLSVEDRPIAALPAGRLAAGVRDRLQQVPAGDSGARVCRERRSGGDTISVSVRLQEAIRGEQSGIGQLHRVVEHPVASGE